MSGAGDARSLAASAVRARSVLEFEAEPSALFKCSFGRHIDRDKRQVHTRSGKSDWTFKRPFNRSFSSGVPFAQWRSYSGPPSKRRALGRYAGGGENDRYGSNTGQLWDADLEFSGQNSTVERDLEGSNQTPRVSRYNSANSTFAPTGAPLWSMTENGKGERDSLWPIPRYSTSPNREWASNEMPDLFDHREIDISPDRRHSSPRRSAQGDCLGHVEQSRSHVWSKHNGIFMWNSTQKEYAFKERIPIRSELYRRTIPMLDPHTDSDTFDRQSFTIRELGHSNISKDYKDYWESCGDCHLLQKTTYLLDNSLSNNSSSSLPMTENMSLWPQDLHVAPSAGSRQDDVCQSSPRKKPRLTWGQGLAKYEKSKVDELGATAKDGNEQKESRPFLVPQTNDGSPGFKFRCEALAAKQECILDVLNKEDLSCDVDGFRTSAVSLYPISVLQEVKTSLSCYQRDASSLSKNLLMWLVERLELEIDLVEKDIVNLKDPDFSVVQAPSNVNGVAVETSGVELWPCFPDCGAWTAMENAASMNRYAHSDGIEDWVSSRILLECTTEHSKENALSSILLSNQDNANRAASSLSHLLPSFNASAMLSCALEEASVWKINVECHERAKQYLETKVSEKRRDMKLTEELLAAKYNALRCIWKHEQVREYCDEFSHLQSTNPIMEQAMPLKEAIQNDMVVREHKSFPLRMPSMHLGQRKRNAMRFMSNNALVEDPVATERERRVANPWSEEERVTFLEKYAVLGKQFSIIAAFFDHKSVADCIEYYYRNQKSEDFDRIHRKHKMKKRRDCLRSTSSYLTTNSSLRSKYQHSDAAYAAGLSVAAAAAAISHPKKNERMIPSVCRIKEGLFNAVKVGPKAYTDKCLENSSTRPETHVLITVAQSVHHRTPNEEKESVWTDTDRELFLRAVGAVGKDFKSIAMQVGTKSQKQCKAFFSKVRKRLSLDHLIKHHKSTGEGSVEKHNIGYLIEQLPVEVHKSEVLSLHSKDSSTHENLFKTGVMQMGLETEEGTCTGKAAQVKHYSTKSVETCIPSECPNTSKDEEASPMAKVNSESFLPSIEDYSHAKFGTLSKKMGVNKVVDPDEVDKLTQEVAITAAVVVESQHGKEKNVKPVEVRARREPTSWTVEEKAKFIEIIRSHGKHWELLQESLPSKSLTQIKTFYQNSKAKLGLACEGVSGRGGLSRKRKAEEVKASTLTSSAAMTLREDVGSEANPVSSSGRCGNGFPDADNLAFAAVPGRSLPQDPNAIQHALHSMGVVAPGMIPIINSSFLGPASFVSLQPPLQAHPSTLPLAMAQTLQPLTAASDGEQPHQPQSVAATHHQELSAFIGQQFLNQANLPNFFHLQQQQHALQYLQHIQQMQIGGQAQFYETLVRPQSSMQQCQQQTQQHQMGVLKELIALAAMVFDPSNCGNLDLQTVMPLLHKALADGWQQPVTPSAPKPGSSGSQATSLSDIQCCTGNTKLFGQSLVSDHKEGKGCDYSSLQGSTFRTPSALHVPGENDGDGGSASRLSEVKQPSDNNFGKEVGCDETVHVPKKNGDAVGGGQVATRGWPQIFDALVTLAQWRLQNSSRSIDDILTQSWNALCQDPGFALEAGKSTVGLIPGVPEALMHLAAMGDFPCSTMYATVAQPAAQGASTNGVQNLGQSAVGSAVPDSKGGSVT